VLLRPLAFLPAKPRGKKSKSNSANGRFPVQLGTVLTLYSNPEKSYTVRVVETVRSAAVARLFWEQKVAGSIPAAPIALRGMFPLCESIGLGCLPALGTHLASANGKRGQASVRP
jgi:hypothetical protein